MAAARKVNSMATRFIWALSAWFLGVYAIVQNISIPVSNMLYIHVSYILSLI